MIALSTALREIGMTFRSENPYRGRPDHTFWRKSVSGRAPETIDLVTDAPFKLSSSTRIATAGSCFAQHIARTLKARGFCYFVSEREPETAGAKNENYSVFSSRYGNIYSTRQLVQLVERAYGLYEPRQTVWRAAAGHYLDAFRPQIQTDGFASEEAVLADRETHLQAVRRLLEQAGVFIFTLGLTETWFGPDGAALPSAPGVVGAIAPPDCHFHNLAVDEMERDLRRFITIARAVNPSLRIILTVSPVPLIATFEDRHVVVSTELSKSALRVVADLISRDIEGVVYFPSYEIVTSHFSGRDLFDDDMRNVSAAGVARVMASFSKHFMSDDGAVADAVDLDPSRPGVVAGVGALSGAERTRALEGIICDEEAIEA